MKSTNNEKRLISLGVITTVHGIRGEVKIRSFTADPQNITAYGPLQDRSGKPFKLTITGTTKDALIARIDGITSRNEAETLRNTELFIPRSALPATKTHQYYHEDLVDLSLITEDGKPYGTITAMHNFGAGDLAAVTLTSGEEELLPFSRKTFQQIDISKGTAVIVLPEIAKDE